MSDPDCSLDDYNKESRNQYGDVSSPEALAELHVICMIVKEDTGVIEQRHASIRRQLHHTSIQVHTQRVEQCSASVVLRMMRRLCKKERGQGAKRAGDHCMEGGGALELAGISRSRGGGGPWRAYCSDQMRK